MDYYQLLEIGRHATQDEIKTSYRKMAIKHHPDKNPGDEKAAQKFKRCTEAFEVLSDAKKKANYDLTLGQIHYHEPKVKKTPPRKPYPHNTTLHVDRGVPNDLSGRTGQGDLNTEQLWKQSGLEGYEKPVIARRWRPRKKPSSFIDP